MTEVAPLFWQYGAIGVIAALALFAVKVMYGQLQADYDREKARGDRLEEELRKINETVRTEYLSTIAKATQAMGDANRAVADALAAVRR